AHHVDGHRHVDVARLEDGFPVVERLQLRELVDVLLHQVGELPDQTPALAGAHLAPRALGIVEGLARRRDRLVDLGRSGLRDLRQYLSRRGINGVEVFLAFDPLAVDEELPGFDLRFSGCGHYFAVKVAGRLSTYAARPSLASSDWKSSCWFSRSIASADSIG